MKLKALHRVIQVAMGWLDFSPVGVRSQRAQVQHARAERHLLE